VQGLLQERDFEWLAAELGLEAGTPEHTALQLRCLYGLDATGIARTIGIKDADAQALLDLVFQLWQARARQAGSLKWYRELLEVMQGAPSGNPPTPIIGFDKHYPNDPAHAHRVAIRARVVTAEDLAFGEDAWRDVSPVEAAQRGKKARRLKRQKKERKS